MRGIPEAMVSRILMCTWSLGALNYVGLHVTSSSDFSRRQCSCHTQKVQVPKYDGLRSPQSHYRYHNTSLSRNQNVRVMVVQYLAFGAW